MIQPNVIRHRAHTVQFYESDKYLCESVCRFLANGFRDGNPMVVIAMPEHRTQFREHLQAHGFDFGQAVRSGQCVQLDAREMLARFMDDDLPDETRFREAILALIHLCRSSRENPKVLAFGEMVNLLWQGRFGRAAKVKVTVQFLL